jgi:putative hydrolase of the HAD superfamily
MGYAELISEYTQPLSPLPTSMRPAGRLAEPIQCVLFDIYGTLFISGSGDISVAQKTPPAVRNLQRLLQKFNIRKTPRDITEELLRVIEGEHRRLRDEGIDYPEIKIDQIWKQILETDDFNSVRRFAVEYELIVNPRWASFPTPSFLRPCCLSGFCTLSRKISDFIQISFFCHIN